MTGLKHLDEGNTDAARHNLTRARDLWSQFLERKAKNRNDSTTNAARAARHENSEARKALAYRLGREARNQNPDAPAGALAKIVRARMTALQPESGHAPYSEKYLKNVIIPGKVPFLYIRWILLGIS